MLRRILLFGSVCLWALVLFACPAPPSPQCGDDCRQASTRTKCLGETQYTLCEKDADGCYQWLPKECPSGTMCDQGRCVKEGTSCDTCEEGAARCDGEKQAVEVCQKNADGCLVYQRHQACGVKQQCDAGKCVTVSSCDKCQAGISRCVDGTSFQRCLKNQSGCLVYASIDSCQAGEICRQGQCVHDPACDTCKEGAAQCDGNAIRTCQKDPSGCLVWQTSRTCAAGERCESGACVQGCQDDKCVVGDLRCSRTGGIQICQPNGQCTSWSTSSSCPRGKVCQNKQCVHDPACDKCSAGEVRCSQGLTQACQQDRFGCFVWDTPKPCSVGTICQSGVCVHDPACDKCKAGETQCDGNGLRTCQKDQNGCLDFAAASACKQGQICQSKQCVHDPACDKCKPGEKRCNGKQVESCAKDQYGCLSWSTPSACQAGYVCKGQGSCQLGCRNDGCQVGAKRCFGGGVQVCQQNGACTTWSQSSACQRGQVCQSGACVHDPACDTCTEGAAQCDGGGTKVCGKDQYGCLVWGAISACQTGQVCQQGKCVAPPCQGDADCALGFHCFQKACRVDVCQRGKTYCKNNNVVVCAANGSSETTSQTCGKQSCQNAQCTCTSDQQCSGNETCQNGTCLDCTNGCGALFIKGVQVASVIPSSNTVTSPPGYAHGKLYFVANNDERTLYKGGSLLRMDLSTKKLTTVLDEADILAFTKDTTHSSIQLQASQDGKGLFLWDQKTQGVLEVSATGVLSFFATPAALQAATGTSYVSYLAPMASATPSLLYVHSSSQDSLLGCTSSGTCKTIAKEAAMQTGTTNLDIYCATTLSDGSALMFDRGGTRLLRVTPQGAVSTFVSKSRLVSATGTQYPAIYALARGPNGNIFALDVGKGIFKITPSGVVSLFTSMTQIKQVFPSFSGSFVQKGIAIDPSGALWLMVDESSKNTGGLLRISPTGTPSLGLSMGEVVKHLDQGGMRIESLIEDKGNLIAWENSTGSLIQMSPGGKVKVLHTYADLEKASGRTYFIALMTSSGLTRDPQTGALYFGEGDIFERSATGTLRLFKSRQDIQTALNRTSISADALAFDKGTLYGLDDYNRVLYSISSAGVVKLLFDTQDAINAGITYGMSVRQMVVSAGAVYFFNQSTDQLVRYDLATRQLRIIFKGSTVKSNTLTGPVLSPAGDLLLFDHTNQKVYAIRPTGSRKTYLDTSKLQSAVGGKTLDVRYSAMSPSGVLYGYDIKRDDIVFWK